MTYIIWRKILWFTTFKNNKKTTNTKPHTTNYYTNIFYDTLSKRSCFTTKIVISYLCLIDFKKIQVWWFCVSFSRKHRCFDQMGREFGHSLSINMVRISMYYILICLLVLGYRCIVDRRDTRGAYHLFGGGVIHKTHFMFQRYVILRFLKLMCAW